MTAASIDRSLASGRRRSALRPGGRHVARVLLLPILVVVSCHHVPLRTPPRVPEPIPEALARHFSERPRAEDFTLELIDESAAFRRQRFAFSYAPRDADGRSVTGEYYQAVSSSAFSPGALLQISPILGGAGDDYLASRVFAGWAADRGFSAFFLHQEETILAPDRRAPDLQELLVRMTRENMIALDVFAARPEIDAERIGSFGISMGAIKNVLFTAVEPRLTGSILCLAGGDFGRILVESREGMVLEYMRERARVTGESVEDIAADFSTYLTADPIRVARHVDPSRVILFLGSLDDKVPYASGIALHRALGEPELHVLPVGHYTAMACAPWAARKGFDWLERRWSE